MKKTNVLKVANYLCALSLAMLIAFLLLLNMQKVESNILVKGYWEKEYDNFRFVFNCVEDNFIKFDIGENIIVYKEGEEGFPGMITARETTGLEVNEGEIVKYYVEVNIKVSGDDNGYYYVKFSNQTLAEIILNNYY